MSLSTCKRNSAQCGLQSLPLHKADIPTLHSAAWLHLETRIDMFYKHLRTNMPFLLLLVQSKVHMSCCSIHHCVHRNGVRHSCSYFPTVVCKSDFSNRSEVVYRSMGERAEGKFHMFFGNIHLCVHPNGVVRNCLCISTVFRKWDLPSRLAAAYRRIRLERSRCLQKPRSKLHTQERRTTS